jgi:hypothetical protein
MARRIINRKEKRAEYDAAERREKTEDEVDEAEDEAEDDEEGDEEEGEEDEEGAAAGGGDDEEVGEGDSDDEDEAPKKKKKVKPPPKPKVKRTRTPKITRVKVVWHVFNNSNQKVAEFEYPKRKDADELAAKLTNDKKNTHFVQPVKIAIE